MAAEELMWKSATEQAELVRSGQVSARELVEACLAAIERRNGELNAVVTLCADEALAEAERVRPGDARPLAGVPILVKDLIALTKGVRTTMGMRALGDWAPDVDSSTVRRLRTAGAIVVGKTNTPELGILPVTEPLRFGPARNPWDTSRTPGGSSGGSGAAVASGMVALAHGNDGGGSIRIPAACNGLFGLKPSRGRVSWAPLFTELVAGFATDGVLTRTVRDTAVALDVIAGYEPGDPYWAPPPSAPFAEAVGRDPGRLRVALATKAPNGVPVDPECVAAAESAAETLRELGHEVTELEAEVDPAYTEHFLRVWCAQTGADVRGLKQLTGVQIDLDQLEPLTREMYELSNGVTATDYLESLERVRGYSREILRYWENADVLLTPTLAKPPIEIGALDPDPGQPALTMLMKAAAWVPFTPAWNATGQPAASLPLHQSADGLPIGVQIVGPPAGEELLLSLSAQLEQARPWADRWPQPAAA